jgi:hypothetical protein
MKTYKFEREYRQGVFSIGDELYIDGKNIVVVTILKVDLVDDIIWFTGVEKSELE